MSDKKIVCQSCEAEFSIHHDEIANPEFCPFCGELLPDLRDSLDEEWDNEDEGC